MTRFIAYRIAAIEFVLIVFGAVSVFAGEAGSLMFRRYPTNIAQSIEVCYIGPASTNMMFFYHGVARTNVPPGAYRVSYIGLGAPYVKERVAPTGVTVVAGAIVEEDVYYFVTNTGALRVELGPAEADGARWKIRGSTNGWQKSGVVLLPPDRYTIEYRATPGWVAAPSNEETDVTLYSVATVTVAYAPAVNHGFISVSLQPTNAIGAGAKWALATDLPDGVWYENGQTAPALIGENAILFKPVREWQVPSPLVVNVLSADTIQATGIYVSCPSGRLTVNMTPSNLLGGNLRWRIAGQPAEYRSGQTAGSLFPGVYRVDLNILAGYDITPTNRLVTVDSGANAVLNFAYQAVSNCTLIGHCLPAFAGGNWGLQYENHVGWCGPEGRMSNLPAGNCRIVFLPVSGYRTPSTQWIYLQPGRTNSFSGIYRWEGRSERIACLLAPDEAAEKCRWRLLDIWHESGDLVAVPGPGIYDIHFEEGAGLIAPSNRSVTISEGETVCITGEYVRLPSVNIVTPRHGSAFVAGEPIAFQGEACNLDHALTNGDWYMGVGGQTGFTHFANGLLTQTSLPDSAYTIYLRAEDAQGVVYFSPTVSFTVKSDGNTNGLPDDWENRYWPADPESAQRRQSDVSGRSLTADESHGADFDWDGDGISNFDEWLADTDPTDRRSFFALDIRADEVDPELRWRRIPNRIYSVYGANALDQDFQLLKQKVATDDFGTHHYPLIQEHDLQFYRVGIER